MPGSVRSKGHPFPDGREEVASYVGEADPYVRCPVSAYELEGNVGSLCGSPLSRFDSTVRLHPASGEVAFDATLCAGSLLPLRLGPLRVSLDAIARRDPWLLPHHLVFYTDQHGEVHIDFPGLAGYVISPSGELLTRAVNPY